jgi:hypothetical protein
MPGPRKGSAGVGSTWLNSLQADATSVADLPLPPIVATLRTTSCTYRGRGLYARPSRGGTKQRTVEIVSDTALWYSPGEPAVPIRWVLIRDPQGEFRTQALLSTDLGAEPERIISWFIRRWQMEATFQEARQRLGFDTQRHWSEKAVGRTAPAMLALFSVVTLLADQYMAEGSQHLRRAAWYDKRAPTFSDALAVVRKELWREQAGFCGSPAETETVEIPREFMERLTDAMCYAA